MAQSYTYQYKNKNGKMVTGQTTDRNLAMGGMGADPAMQVAANASEVAKLKAEAAAKPKMAAYENVRGTDGQLKTGYQLQAGPAVTMNTQAADELRRQAMMKESPWLAQQLEQNKASGTRQMNSAAQMAATGAASTQASLARRGGLSSGASERAAANAANQRALMQQDVLGQTDMNALNLSVNDAQSQRNLLSSIPGLDLQQANFQQAERGYNTDVQKTNLANTLADVASKRQFDLGKYSEDMKAYGADKSADAVKKGGGGSVICTACYETGLVSKEVFDEAAKTRGKITKEKYKAYLKWAVPVARLIKKAPVFGLLLRPAVRYLAGDRDLAAITVHAVCNGLTNVLTKKPALIAVEGI